MSPLGVIFRGLVILIAFLLAFAVLAFILKIVSGVFIFVAVIGCIAFALYAYKKIFKKVDVDNDKKTTSVKISIKSDSVKLFRDEPTVGDLVEITGSGLPAKVSIEVANDCEATILSTSDIAYKVKIKSGPQQGKVGWVDKAFVAAQTKRY